VSISHPDDRPFFLSVTRTPITHRVRVGRLPHGEAKLGHARRAAQRRRASVRPSSAARPPARFGTAGVIRHHSQPPGAAGNGRWPARWAVLWWGCSSITGRHIRFPNSGGGAVSQRPAASFAATAAVPDRWTPPATLHGPAHVRASGPCYTTAAASAGPAR